MAGHGVGDAGRPARCAWNGHCSQSNFSARVDRVLAATPLIDGHNDLPWELRDRTKGALASIDLRSDTTKLPAPEGGSPLMTDIPRLRAGHVGGQFWSVWVPTELKGNDAVQATLEQIDIVKRMVATYPDDFQMAYTAADIRRIHRSGKIASLIGVEGGHSIDNSLATLRMMYDLGARYMTLTHSDTLDWADAATDTPKHQRADAVRRGRGPRDEPPRHARRPVARLAETR